MNIPPSSRSIPPRPENIAVRVIEFSIVAAATERFDRFLADQLSLSRTQAARLIAAGAVRVDGTPARASAKLERRARVRIEFPIDAPPRSLMPHPRTIDVAYEDASLLVLDKPAGLVVHPAPGHWSDTLVNVLVARGTALSDGTAGRPGIVHRLDKDTSGLLIVAKTDDAHRTLAGALARRAIGRRYAVLVWGHLREDVMVIDAPLRRHPKDRKRMAVLASGRAAQTEVTRVARFETCDLLRVRLLTGRTHQIRVHLAHVGHPVVGDPTYALGGARRVTGSQRPAADAIERVTSRQALHAAELRLRHPVTGEPLILRSEWPCDLRESLVSAAGDPTLVDQPDLLGYFGFFEA